MELISHHYPNKELIDFKQNNAFDWHIEFATAE